MERKDFKPVIRGIKIDREIWAILQDIAPTPLVSYQHEWVLAFREYPYTWIRRSKSNPCRLSGFPIKALESQAFTYKGSEKEAFSQLTEHFEPTLKCRQKKGVHLKPGNFIRAIVSQDFSEGDIESWAEQLASKLRRTSGLHTEEYFKISDKPSEIYTIESRFCSCMRGNSKARFQLYDDLKDTRILYMMEDSCVIGRALIHDNVDVLGVGAKIKVMDRIYSNNSATESQFIQWAEMHDYWYKQKQALGCREFVSPKSNEVRTLEVSIDCGDLTGMYTEVPYIDTFHDYFHELGVLANTDTIDSHYSYTTLNNTDGTDNDNLLVESPYRCCNCNCSLDEEYTSRNDAGDLYCDECFSERYSYCHRCDSYEDAESFCSVNDRYEYVCESCYQNNYQECTECEESFRDDEMTDNSDGYPVCPGCLENHYSQCEDCDDYVKTLHNVEGINGRRHVCEHCRDNSYTQCEECNTYHDQAHCPECYEEEEEVAA